MVEELVTRGGKGMGKGHGGRGKGKGHGRGGGGLCSHVRRAAAVPYIRGIRAGHLYRAHQRHKAACPGGLHCCTCAIRVPASRTTRTIA